MKMFRCGCKVDMESLCPTHNHWPCHDDFGCAEDTDDNVTKVCPPCWLARLRTVSLSAKATPTRNLR